MRDCHYRTSPIRYWSKGSTVGWYKVLRFLYLWPLIVIIKAVHGSGGSGLCLTHNWPTGDWVGRCPTRNRTAGDRVLRVGFPLGEHCFRVKLKPTRNHWKKGENQRDLSQSIQDLMQSSRSSKDFAKSDAFSHKLCRESPDLVFWSPKSAKSCWKTRRKAWIHSGSFSLWAG